MARVFISYVRENSRDVTRLARDLRAHGLDPWIDKEHIGPGTRWQDQIRQGISSGDFFIACFSRQSAEKDASYMNEELTQAIEQLRRRPTDRTWFIPVRFDDCEIPDRSIGAGETLRSIQWVDLHGRERLGQDGPIPPNWHEGVRRIVRAILPDTEPWVPYDLEWNDGTTLVVLPLRPSDGFVASIGKHPVTNAQFREFVTDGRTLRHSGASEPMGEHLVEEDGERQWKGPFYPWRESDFSDPDQPVVCVTYGDALDYARWASTVSRPGKRISRRGHPEATPLATPSLWDWAAFGTLTPERRKETWLTTQPSIHQMAGATAPIDTDGGRTNSMGVSDMVGNVWEWCCGEIRFDSADLTGYRPGAPELRGGGYLDDLGRISPFLHVRDLRDEWKTSHSDLGFRIAMAIPAEDVPSEVLRKVATCERAVNECWILDPDSWARRAGMGTEAEYRAYVRDARQKSIYT